MTLVDLVLGLGGMKGHNAAAVGVDTVGGIQRLVASAAAGSVGCCSGHRVQSGRSSGPVGVPLMLPTSGLHCHF